MSKFLTHEPTQTRKTTKKATKPEVQAANGLDTELLSFSLEDLGESVEKIAYAIASYRDSSQRGDNCLDVFTGKNSHPMRLELEGEAVDKIADALSRIADALTPRIELPGS